MTAFKHPLLFRPGKCPPRGFDVFRFYRLVGTGEVQPYAEALELVIHQFLVGDRKIPAFFDERLNPELLNVFLGLKPELLFDLHLDREAVHVVPGPVDYVPSAHPVVPKDAVL